MWIQKCVDMSAFLKEEGHVFLGFDPEKAPSLEKYALQTAYPFRSFIESKIHYDMKRGKSAEHSFNTVVDEFKTANKVWNRLVTEHGWTADDYPEFDDALLDYVGPGNDTYLGYLTASGRAEEYQLIEFANKCWNAENRDKPQKAEKLLQERALITLQRYDEAAEKERQKGLKDLHHYTNGADVSGLDADALRKTFGDRAQSIIYVLGYMEKDANHAIRHRKQLIEQFKNDL